MTPDERAEKIRKDYLSHGNYDAVTAAIAAQIREAVEEAFQHQVSEEIPKYFRKGFAEGKAEAYEDAAKIADEWKNSPSCDHHDTNPCCHVRTGDGIATKIRARAEEMK